MTEARSRNSGRAPSPDETGLAQATRSVPRLSIETPPNYGDFKAFTRPDRLELTFLGYDPATRRMSLESSETGVRTLVVGGPAERVARALRGQEQTVIRLVHWGNLYVIGVPFNRRTYSGHTLFRAEDAD